MESNDRNFLYRPERGVDYFVLILQGHTDVQVGREGMKFDGGPFQVFGEQSLTCKLRQISAHFVLSL